MKYLDRCLIQIPCHYALCRNEAEFRKELKRLGIKEHTDFLKFAHAQATVHYFENTEAKKDPVVIVCLGETAGEDPISVYGLLMHEAVHIFQYVKEYLGEEFPSKEFEAYAIQRIALNLMWAFEEASK